MEHVELDEAPHWFTAKLPNGNYVIGGVERNQADVPVAIWKGKSDMYPEIPVRVPAELVSNLDEVLTRPRFSMKSTEDGDFQHALNKLRTRINVALLTGRTPEEVVDAHGFVEAVVALIEHARIEPPEGV